MAIKRFTDRNIEKNITFLKQERFDKKIKPFLYQIAIKMRNGADYTDIAKFLHMTPETFLKYRRDFPEIQKALDAGKESNLATVESELYHQAEGYDYKEVHEDIDPKTNTVVKRKEITKHKHGDMKAIMFILCNRASDKWRHKIEYEGTNKNIGIMGQVDVSDAAIKKVMDEFKTQQDMKDEVVEVSEIDQYLEE